MGQKEAATPRSRAGQLDHQVADLRGQRDTLLGAVKPDGSPRDAYCPKLLDHGLGDRPLLSGHAFYGEEL